MPFSSTVFMCLFLPSVLAGYYLIPGKLKAFWLFAASIMFYAFGQTVYAALLVFLILFNWIWGLLISSRLKRGRKPAVLLGAACFINIAPLLFFQYANPVTDAFSRFVGVALPFRQWGSPVGVSFFTLQSLAYCVDVYRGDAKASGNPVSVGLAISFFPKIIAGPIVGYNKLSLETRRPDTGFRKLAEGACRFTVGLSKKTLLADQLAPVADYIFNWSAMGRFNAQTPVATAWLGLAAFALQIYFELSGYADMAVGLGKMFGLELPENFRYPYSAPSVTEFWKRWNITLLEWFRGYVYRPLQSLNSSNNDAVVQNLLVVWLLIGLWHGGGATMLLFGVWFFLLLLAEHFFEFRRRMEGFPVVSRIYSMLAVMMGWVLLRADSVYNAGRYFMNLFGLNYNSLANETTYVLYRENAVLLLVGFLACTPLARSVADWARSGDCALRQAAYSALYVVCVSALLLLSMIYILHGGFNEYLHFR